VVFRGAVHFGDGQEASAASATLEITGMNSQTTENFAPGTTSFLWSPPPPTAAEDVYDITLTFRDAGNAVVGALTSRLAAVTGTYTPAAVDAVPDSAAWSRAKGNPVIPYDAAWAEATAGSGSGILAIAKVNGAAKNHGLPDASGYFGWKLTGSDWGYGAFALTLSFPPAGW